MQAQAVDTGMDSAHMTSQSRYRALSTVQPAVRFQSHPYSQSINLTPKGFSICNNALFYYMHSCVSCRSVKMASRPK